MSKLIFITTVILISSFSFAKDYLFSFDMRNTDTSIVFFKKKMMDSFFKQNIIEWNNNGIYLFIEKRNITRLYVIEESFIYLYQFPIQKKSPWLNPNAYLKERSQLSNVDEKKCFLKFNNNQIYHDIIELELEKLPYISLSLSCVKCDNDSLNHKSPFSYPLFKDSFKEFSYYFGYKKNGLNVEYFSLKNFINNEIDLYPPLDVFYKVFEVLEKELFSTILEECK